MLRKHCACSYCTSDGRQEDKAEMQGVKFYPFPKPKSDQSQTGSLNSVLQLSHSSYCYHHCKPPSQFRSVPPHSTNICYFSSKNSSLGPRQRPTFWLSINVHYQPVTSIQKSSNTVSNLGSPTTSSHNLLTPHQSRAFYARGNEGKNGRHTAS